MKEFGNIISVYPISELDANQAPWLTDLYGNHFFSAESFIYDPQENDQDAGVLFDCDKTFIIDTPSRVAISIFSYPVKSILVVSDTDGNKYPIGSIKMPGTVLIQKGIQKSRLIFKYQGVLNPF